MKYLSICLVALLGLASCKKNNDDLQIQPPAPKLISKDSVKTGAYWGMTVGSDPGAVYAKLVEMKTDKKITYIGVTANVFSSLDSLANKIPLYHSIFLDEQTGTSTGVQIGFTNDKVTDIYLNSGIRLAAWPGNSGGTASIAVGDSSTAIYQKLVNIKAGGNFNKKFERISLFYKNINKAYDTHMGISPQWYVIAADTTNTKRYYEILLNFKNGKLDVIYASLYEQQ